MEPLVHTTAWYSTHPMLPCDICGHCDCVHHDGACEDCNAIGSYDSHDFICSFVGGPDVRNLQAELKALENNLEDVKAERDTWRKWFEEAAGARDAAGIVGCSPAQAIKLLDEELDAVRVDAKTQLALADTLAHYARCTPNCARARNIHHACSCWGLAALSAYEAARACTRMKATE